MMSINKYLIPFLLLVFICSCTSEQEPFMAPEKITLSSSEISVSEDGDANTIYINSNTSWTISSDQSWVYANIVHGNSGQETVRVSAEENTSGESRTARLCVASKKSRVYCTVKQPKKIFELSTSKTELTFDPAGEQKSFRITTNGKWYIYNCPSWLTLSSTEGTKGTFELIASASENTESYRYANIIISCGNVTKEISVDQENIVLSASPSSLSFTSSDVSKSLSISCNTQWSITDYPSWMQFSSKSGSSSKNITCSATNNTSTNSRSGTIRIMAGSRFYDVSVKQEGKPSFTCDVSSLYFNSQNSSQTITLTASSSWQYDSKPSWITLSRTYGNSGTYYITCTASANTSSSSRTGTIVFSMGSYSVYVYVTQEAKPTLVCDVSSLYYTSQNSSKSITLTASDYWQCYSKPSWISLSRTSGSSGTYTITCTASANSSSSSRSGTITFSMGSYTYYVSVTQEGKSSLSCNVTSLSYTSQSSSKTITLTATDYWEYTTKPSWITLSKTYGYGGTFNITCTASANTSTSSRSGTIKFSMGSYSVSISVTQDGIKTPGSGDNPRPNWIRKK